MDIFISGKYNNFKLELCLTAVLLGINVRVPSSPNIVPYLNVRLLH